MKKLKLGVFLLSTLCMSASFAMKQKVELCLEVKDNTTDDTFSATVRSSDLFDMGNHTGPITNGQKCVTHLYHYGPKNLQLSAKLVSSKADNVKILVDQSCYFLHNDSNQSVVSDFLRSNDANESWTLRLSQDPSIEVSKHAYTLSCEHNSN